MVITMKYSNLLRTVRFRFIVVLSISFGMCALIVPAERLEVIASDQSGVTQYADGVTVQKNSDGTIEVSDTGGDGADFAPSSPAPVRKNAARRSSSRVRSGITRYSDGVLVRRNSDGSVEVTDTHSAGSHAFNSKTKHRRSGKRMRTVSRYNGVNIRRNSDGSIEVWDAPTIGHFSN